MMLNDGRICFIVVPDKKYYGLLLKIYGSHFKLPVLQKNPTRVRAPSHIRLDITIGEPAKHNQNRKKAISQNHISRIQLFLPIFA